MTTRAPSIDVQEGQTLWEPTANFLDSSKMAKFRSWLEHEIHETFQNYEEFWKWSVDNPEIFWESIWKYFDIICDSYPSKIFTPLPDGRGSWFVGSQTNYAEHVLRHEGMASPNDIALISYSEARAEIVTSWSELGASVRRLATKLRDLGIGPGDRVVSYMPNAPETVTAMLATASIGAIWAAASPEFGAELAIDRFGQVEPKLAFIADGYRYSGRDIDRRPIAAEIVASLNSLEHVIWLDYLGLGGPEHSDVQVTLYSEAVAGSEVSREDFQFHRVPFDHPLWILFSSGTTGKPKAIVHSHVSMIAEHLKLMTFHMNSGPDSRNFFFTTTGWMMWNLVVSSLITGASAVLYDGNPLHKDSSYLWRIVEQSKATLFGVSPALVQRMIEDGIRPRADHDLSALQMILLGGAPSTPDIFRWCYDEVKSDLWVTSQSGGTEICSGFVGSVPWRPVRAGQIQGPCLGMDVHAWNDEGKEVIDEVGELVVTSPTPAMPLFLWGDGQDKRYLESYYSAFPNVWLHGDRIRFDRHGGCYIYGRSDSTLNRYGVRIGTAEIYSVVNSIEGVRDSLAVCCEALNGNFYLPLFVELDPCMILDEELKERIQSELRSKASPRHVPDEMHLVPGVPYTLTGKKLEVPIRKILMGTPMENALSRDVVSNPECLDWYAKFGEDLRARVAFAIQ